MKDARVTSFNGVKFLTSPVVYELFERESCNGVAQALCSMGVG